MKSTAKRVADLLPLYRFACGYLCFTIFRISARSASVMRQPRYTAVISPDWNWIYSSTKQQQPRPNVGNTTVQIPTNVPAAPAKPRRAVSVVNLPAVPAKREWLCGTDLMRGAVSMLVAPGARAKTTWLLTCALSCASRYPLLGAHVYGGPHRVLYLSAEDFDK